MQQHVGFESPTRTPAQSPRKKTMMITEAQKQALMDNLQLEVTERARKLRAQYALRAQSLRTRIELRINRIPHSLRKANMGELCQKYQEAVKEALPQVESSGPEPVKPQEQQNQPVNKTVELAPTPRPRGVKRSSEHLENADKENTPDPAQNIANPKKRPKNTADAPSRQVTNPSTVLSPKSLNSRTLQSPVRPVFGSPQKLHLSRPVSPLKPASPSKQFSFATPSSPAKFAAIAATNHLADLVTNQPKAARGKAPAGRKGTTKAATATKPASTRSKRGMEPPPIPETRTVSSQSNTSTTSNATTVVKKGGRAQKVAAPAAQKKKVNEGVSAAGKKVADAPPTGRRVLRKRA
ncbi:MAG: hypothetical protein HETSPECPRED_008083 [Heterodermia speciosa]|uniref:Borealin N-terminal domain-containing protein n=1 Tax=Heterodermia speciosa TaxID=116794 RepID=A0A8H3I5U2_9LECA|nr:MAG: hypothetical protein HETSPECPRED_008083 [Heterodermia speciosa]